MAKLLGDLPENWTMGQTISPNGTEAGLTEKHGYNYLMKQVNLAQKEVNNINTELEGVAKQETSEDILSKIGAADDTGGSQTAGTTMAKINYLIQNTEKLKSMLNNIEQEITAAGNLTEIIVPTTVVSDVKVTGDKTTYTVDNVVIDQSENHVYAITVQGTSDYKANISASLVVYAERTDTTGEITESGPIDTLSYGNSTKLDDQGAQRLTCYVTAINITAIRFRLSSGSARTLSLDWYRVERLR